MTIRPEELFECFGGPLDGELRFPPSGQPRRLYLCAWHATLASPQFRLSDLTESSEKPPLPSWVAIGYYFLGKDYNKRRGTRHRLVWVSLMKWPLWVNVVERPKPFVPPEEKPFEPDAPNDVTKPEKRRDDDPPEPWKGDDGG